MGFRPVASYGGLAMELFTQLFGDPGLRLPSPG
jgi:hypothetical protein